jgi:hypothetical protein
MSRKEIIRNKKPDLVVDLWLYPSDRGGREHPIMPGWSSPCTVQQEEGAGWVGYDGWPQLGDTKMEPGESRRVGYVFMSGEEAVAYLSATDKFYVWEGRIIGEATIVTPGI